MSMFDWIDCHYPLPQIQRQEGRFLTRSLGERMKHYAISYQGRLMLDLSSILGDLEAEQKSPYGVLRNYTGPLTDLAADWVRVLEQALGCPVTPEDDDAFIERIKTLDSHVTAYHFMAYRGDISFYGRCLESRLFYTFSATFKDGWVQSMDVTEVR